MARESAIAAKTEESDTSSGVSIFVRIDIHQNKYEGLTGNSVTLKVDAYGNGYLEDVNESCVAEGNFADQATQDLLPRPSISNEDPISFIIKD
jgi:hypothetical protein